MRCVCIHVRVHLNLRCNLMHFSSVLLQSVVSAELKEWMYAGLFFTVIIITLWLVQYCYIILECLSVFSVPLDGSAVLRGWNCS